MIDPGKPIQSASAKQREMNGKSQRTETRIGADIARGLFAADMLFARRKRQNEAASPLGIYRLTRKSARHLAQEFLTGRKQPDIGPAEIQPVAQRLTFAR